MFNCEVCNSKLVWCNDFSSDDFGYEFEGIVGVYQCCDCELMYSFISNFDTDEEYLVLENYDY